MNTPPRTRILPPRIAPGIRLVIAGVLVALWLASAPAKAVPPDPNTKQQVRALVIKGHKAFRGRHYKRALHYYRAANRLWPSKELQFNLALVYIELRDPVAAGTHLRRYLKQSGPSVLKKLPKVFRRLLKRIATLTVEAPNPAATIWIGGKQVGARRAEVVLLPGRHRVEVRLEDRIVASRELTLVGGQVLKWKPRAALPPVKGPPAPSGSGKKLHWAYFAALSSVAVVAGSVMIYTGVRARALKADYNAAPSLELRQEGTRYMNATNALIAVAGSAAVAALVVGLYTRWRPRERSGKLVILPSISPRGAGLWLRWQQ